MNGTFASRGPNGRDGVAGEQGPPGTNGTNGTNGVDGKTVRSGSGAPSNGLGVDGDFYIDTSANQIYGPKAAGVWPSGVSLVGPAGATGATGAAGNGLLNDSGSAYVLASNLSWSVATKTQFATFTFTTDSTGKITILFYGNVGVTNNGWGDIGCEVVGQSGTTAIYSVHGHTNGPRMGFIVPNDLTLSANTQYTLSLFVTLAIGTISAGPVSNPGVQHMKCTVRKGA